MRIRFDKVDGFIRVQDGATYIESFDPEEDDTIFDKIRCLTTQKSGIAYAIFHNLQWSKLTDTIFYHYKKHWLWAIYNTH